ncbi:MAG: hypothetical protein ACE37N_05975 [Pseudohongiellaceae bacterium]
MATRRSGPGTGHGDEGGGGDGHCAAALGGDEVSAQGKESQEGFYDLRFYGETESGETLNVKVYGDRDPGYGSTSKMLAQAGISLCKDVSREQRGGGFWTPATVFDERLFERLQSYAGLSFEVLEGASE